MKKMFSGKLAIVSMLGIALIFSACRKNEGERLGCTDPEAINYNHLANADNDSCEYLELETYIFKDKPLYWNDDPVLGAVQFNACVGEADTITYIKDTLGNGLRQLFIRREAVTGRATVVGQIINKYNIEDYGKGYIKFFARLGDSVQMETFEVAMHGSTCSYVGSCPDVCRSASQIISTRTLNDSTFNEIVVPISDFPRRYLKNSDNLITIMLQDSASTNDTLLFVRNIRYTTTFE